MIKINQEKCLGCGLCASRCPDTFQMNLDGKSEVIKDKITPCAKEAAQNCPAGAIIIKE